MEEKPVTSLVLFQPLEIVSRESLPKKFTQELVEINQQKKQALDKLRASLVPACVSSVFIVVFACTTVYTLMLGSSVFAYLLSVSALIGFSIGSFFFVRGHKRDVDAYRQITVSPQLQIGAANESLALGMADVVNDKVVIWNKRVQCAPPEDIDGRYASVLKNERTLILSKIETLKKVIKAIKKDSFDPEKE